MDSEWTRDGSLKSNLRVDADGNLDRYLQECMMVHDLSLIHILCVLNYEDDVLRDSAKEMPCEVTFFSSKQKIANGLYQNDNKDIVDAKTGEALMNMSAVSYTHLDVYKRQLDDMVDLLCDGGRLSIITFHSLEDRMVKTSFKKQENPCTCPPDFPVCVCGKKPKGKVVTRKPILPSEEELERNTRSKSAKLRVFEKIES